MKKRFKKLFATIFTVALALQLTSCYSSTTCVGNITPDDPAVKVNKVMNHHFLFGLIPAPTFARRPISCAAPLCSPAPQPAASCRPPTTAH